MTTKFEHSIINPLTKNTLIIHHCYQNPEIKLLRVKPPSMERILKSQKIDSMKKMMLMQEQVFKQQVEEMHRLYNLQKKLMQEIENGQKQHNFKQNFQEFSTRNGPINEVSGSNSAENMQQNPIKFDLEMAADDSTPSSSIHPFEEMKKVHVEEEGGDVEVELTLSIGHCTRKQRSKSTDQSRKVQESDHRMKEAQEVASSSSSVFQENRRPHWLMQDLSLNRT